MRRVRRARHVGLAALALLVGFAIGHWCARCARARGPAAHAAPAAAIATAAPRATSRWKPRRPPLEERHQPLARASSLAIKARAADP